MPIYLGTPKVKNLWLGTSKVKNVWAGLDKIYSTDNKKYLYNEGDECIEVTGGWGINGYKQAGSTRGVNLATKNADNIYSHYYAGGNIYIAGTANLIDLSNYSTIHFLVDVTGIYTRSGTTYGLYFHILNGKDVQNNRITDFRMANLGVHEYSFDISNINSGYLCMDCDWLNECNGEYHKVWLE